MDPYIGEIRLFAGSYAPENWHLCDGTLLPISGNEALFSLIGTSYGGDGRTTFGLPDLRSRVCISQGQGTNLTNRTLAQNGGTETVTLTEASMPSHTHTLNSAGTNATTSTAGTGVTFANTLNGDTMYLNNGAAMATQAIPALTSVGVTGASIPHNNIMPGLGLTYIICTVGIFPQFP